MNEKLLDASGERFNVFKLCGVNHYENTHSSIISEFLNPKGSHGFCDQFLKAFLEVIECEMSIDTQSATVQTEVRCDGGRMDILISDKDNYGIVIENKIYASDQHQQLVCYSKFLKQRFKNGNKLYYLTLDGREASSDSAKDKATEEKMAYQLISYEKTILDWLSKCVIIASERPFVHETLRQYANLVKQLTNQTLGVQAMEDITNVICAKAENFNAAAKIANNIALSAQEKIITFKPENGFNSSDWWPCYRTGGDWDNSFF